MRFLLTWEQKNFDRWERSLTEYDNEKQARVAQRLLPEMTRQLKVEIRNPLLSVVMEDLFVYDYVERGPSCEASSLGWKPGEWPAAICVKLAEQGFKIYEIRSLDDRGAIYVSADGHQIKVFND